MKLVSLSDGRLRAHAPEGWLDVTAQVGVEEAPFTLGRAGGHGALQFALGVQQHGMPPRPGPEDLLAMCAQIAMQRELRDPFDVRVDVEPRPMGGMSFRAEDAFVRVWVVFDGRAFIAATYVCGWDERDAEVAQAELIVRSVRASR